MYEPWCCSHEYAAPRDARPSSTTTSRARLIPVRGAWYRPSAFSIAIVSFFCGRGKWLYPDKVWRAQIEHSTRGDVKETFLLDDPSPFYHCAYCYDLSKEGVLVKIPAELRSTEKAGTALSHHRSTAHNQLDTHLTQEEVSVICRRAASSSQIGVFEKRSERKQFSVDNFHSFNFSYPKVKKS